VGFFSKIVDWITTPYTVYLILKDSTIARSTKMRAIFGLVFIFAYVVSPIDLIPDFIPFAGWLDDLIIVPLGLMVVRKITPGIDIAEKRARAQASIKRILLWTLFSLFVAALLVLLWLGLLIYAFIRLIAAN
jgi:uncharacterized membrane protein YkvA (DUF1232 family)